MNNVRAVRAVVAVSVAILVGATNLTVYVLTAIGAAVGRKAKRK